MFYSAWFIGSVTIPDQEFKVNGADVTLPAGTYYLSDPVAGLSLLDQFQLVADPEAPGFSAYLIPSGKVRIAADAVFSVTWGSAALLRDMLGFGNVVVGSAAYTAVNKSALWWSPGKPALFALSPLAVTGARRHIVSQSVAAYTGKAESTSHGSRLFQRFEFLKVDAERMQTTDTAIGGEYDAWFAQVAVQSANFKVYHNAVESTSGTDPFTYESVHGPYNQPLGSDASWQYKRSDGMTWTDLCADVTIVANGCPEIT